MLTDYTPVEPPAITLPSRGESYEDPVFGTRILRVTDEQDGDLCTNAYAYWPALNRDSTRLLISCDGVALLYRFDGAAFTATPDGTLTGEDGLAVQFEGAYWSSLDPDVLYALDYGTGLWRIDVANRGAAGYTLVRDFAGLFPYPYAIFQLHVSRDDRVFTFHTRDTVSWFKTDVLAYDQSTDEIFVFPRGDWEIDESQVDPLGRFVLVHGSFNNQGFKIWHHESGVIDDFAWGNIDDKPGGHIDLGEFQMVNSDGWDTGLIVRSYDALHGAENLLNVVQYLRPDGSLNWSIADHVSMRNVDGTFVVGSTYGGDGSWSAFEDEIYLAYTDGSGFVRLAHSRSYQNGPNADWNYYASPRAVVDRLGRHIVYTSDLGSPSHIDVMILQIPAELWPTPPDPPGTPDAGPDDPGPFDAGAGDPVDPPPGGNVSSGCSTTTGRASAPFAILAGILAACGLYRPRRR